MGASSSKPEGDKSQLVSLKKIQTNMGKIKLTDKDNTITFTSAKTSINELVKNIETKPEETKPEETKQDGSETKQDGSETKQDGSETKQDGSETKPEEPTTLRGGKRKHRTRRRSKQRDKSTRSLRLI